MGFRELEHTADIMLMVWGADLREFYSEAVRGLASLLAGESVGGEDTELALTVNGYDREEKLVALLNSCIRTAYSEKTICISVQSVSEEKDSMQVKLKAKKLPAGFDNYRHEIKAATYHLLKVVEKPGRLEAKVVFDV